MGHFGKHDASQGESIDQLVLDKEITGYVERVVRGNGDINDESFTLDVIASVSRGRNFFGENYSVKHYSAEQWFMELSIRF